MKSISGIYGFFFEKKGSIDILHFLETPRSFSELEEATSMSPNTVSSRLREAQKLGFVEEKLMGKTNDRFRAKYVLTKKGRKMIKSSKKTVIKYMQLRSKIQDLEQKRKEKEKEMEKLLSSLKSSGKM